MSRQLGFPFKPLGGGYYPRTPVNGAPTNTATQEDITATAGQQRYLPPQKRIGTDTPNPLSRPDSAMSKASFETQIKVGDRPKINVPHRGSLKYPPNQPTPPNGVYRYNPADLQARKVQFGVDHVEMMNVPGVSRFKSDVYSKKPNPNSSYGLGSGMSFENGGSRPGFDGGRGGRVNGPDFGAIGTKRPNKGMRNSMLPLPPPPSNGGPADYATMAAYKARLVMSGAADDPRDPDYGNPGDSRHHTAIYKKIAAEPRRGMVAAAAGQADNSNSDNAVVRAANIRGNAAAYLGTKEIPPPEWLADTDDDFTPSFDMAFTNLPFIEACRVAKPSTAGVLRIRNLPYLSTKAEICAFLGRNAQVVMQPIGTPFMAIHIMMDRLSGKTADAFVEVETPKEAKTIYKSFQRRLAQGRGARLGDRAVVVEESSQQELMSEMFPRAKNTTFPYGVPMISDLREEFYPGVYSTGFIGFLKEEEISHMIKHVENPTRSPYAQRCLVRPFECIISTIYKYPWFDVENILITERDSLFKVIIRAIDALIDVLSKNGSVPARYDATQPSSVTLKELVVCALTCPGFTEVQKARVIRHLHQGNFGQYTSSKGMNLSFGGTDMYASAWPFLGLVKKPCVSDGLVEYIGSVFRDITMGSKLSIADMHQMEATGRYAEPLGRFAFDYSGTHTLADVGRLELRTIENYLKLALPEQDSRPPQDRNTYRALGYGQYR